MAFSSISYSSRRLTIHKAVTKPRFNEKTVLVTDAWDYVDLWLKRAKEDRARFHWSQARSFYLASAELPPTAAPLTAYYCFLNATKALLLTKGVQFGDRHGVTGYTIPGKTALSNEQVIFKRGGILAALCQHLGEPTNGETYSLKSLLYNLPYVHRAYDLTYASSKELFIPVHSPEIVRSTTTHEAWFVAELRDRYANDRTTKKLPVGFERELGDPSRFLVRCRRRFRWRPNDRAASIRRYTNYHSRIRKHLYYICGVQRLWYIKRGGNIADLINRSSLALTFAAMHKLSELSRYTPHVLARHFDCQHNWLLTEFIQTAPVQFVDEISAELTGLEFMIPGRTTTK